MIDISVHELNKYYGANHVLKGISFEIFNGEKVGLLGKNGSGKTTMFKIIAEEEPFESGSMAKASGKIVEVLAQIPVFAEHGTVEDILRSSFADINEVYESMKKIEGDEDPKVLMRYGTLMEEYERLGGYEMDYKIDKICNGMNLQALRDCPFTQLSGGEKTRVNLARILLRDCDILLLDEPTNHLDLASLEWLENFLREYSGTVVVISHDRVFLDNVITRIIEIEEGKANFYSGNYTWFAEEKHRRITSQTQQYERQQKEIKRIEERAKWFVIQNRFTTKHHAILSRIDHMDKVDKPITSRKMTEDFINSKGHASKVIVSLESVYKRYGETELLHNIDLDISRNDRVALIGPNGCGKTTLIKMIMEEEPYDNGIVKVSSNVKIIYLPQIINFDDENATVLETFRAENDVPEGKARSILTKFRFRTPDIAKKVSTLSGGEKSRLKLCLLMQETANFLIMDEPTNHLDIDSREWIEDAVADWEGTMLFISHDRYFLEKFATKIWSMQDGSIDVYDDFLSD